MSTWSLNRFSQHQFTQSTVELVAELVLVRRTYTKTGHLTLKFLLVAHDSFILNEVRRTMTASILLFQSNEEDLLRKWEYANLLTFPRAWLWTAPVCTFTHTYIPLLYILKGVFPLSIQVLFCLRMQKFFLDLEPGSTQNYWICAQAFACLLDLFATWSRDRNNDYRYF